MVVRFLATTAMTAVFFAADQIGPAAKGLTDYGALGIFSLAGIAFFFYAWRREATRADKWEAVALRLVEQNSRLLIGAEVAVDVLKQVPKQPQGDR